MLRRVGSLSAEITQGEGQKFTAPILCVHGLWSTEVIWRAFSGFLTHRGWETIAIRLRGRDGTEPDTVEQHVDDLRSAIRSRPAPPVILGHDLGALLALRVAESAAAVVAIAPLVPPPIGNLEVLKNAGGWLERWRGGPLSRPRGRRLDAAYSAGDPATRESVTMLADLREYDRKLTRPARPLPILVVAGALDPVTPPDAARRLAEQTGAELELIETAGHALLSEPGWEERVSRIHRWLIRHLGVDLLALYEESLEE